MKILSIRNLAVLVISAAISSPHATAGQYGETFDSYAVGASNLSPAGTLYSNQIGTTAKVVGAAKELRLTADLTRDTKSAFILPDLDPGKRVLAFSAKWNSPVTGNPSSGFGLGDGMSLNFGPLAAIPASSFANNLFSPSAPINHERGFNVGLAVGLVTWRSASPGYEVRVGGKLVPNGYVAKPSSAWGTANTKRHFFEVDWNFIDGLTLRVDREAVFTGLPTPGFVPQVGDWFGFGARTGSAFEEISLDNITIVTDGVLGRSTASSPYFSSLETPLLGTAAMAFDGDVTSKWVAAAASGHIGASFPTAPTTRIYTLTSGGDFPARDPKNWSFETSVDGTNWISGGTATSQYFQTRNEQRAFVVPSPLSAPAFRLNISANNDDSSTQLAEFEPMELVPGPVALTVTNLSDSGAGSLRQALADAAVDPASNAILFSPATAGGTIALLSELEINDPSPLAIDAIPVGGITLSGGGISRIMSNSGSGLLVIRRIGFVDGKGAVNEAGGLAAKVGTTTRLSECQFTGCQGSAGGGVSNSGTMTVTGSTFSGNSADAEGGAIHNEGNMVITLCTLNGNTARSHGGAIRNFNGNLTINRCTISGNASLEAATGGISHVGTNPVASAVLTVTDSIIAGNTGLGTNCDIHSDGALASLTRLGANIVTFQTLANGASESGPATITTNPLLAPLANYGGPRQTMALALGSPALNAASAAGSFSDQRGFPVVGAPDIGAYEAGTFTFTDFGIWIWEKLPQSATGPQHSGNFDFDGDGFTNAQEFLTLNDPADSNSFFRITNYGPVAGNFNVQYPTLRGRTYTLQVSLDLISWTNHSVTTNGNSVNSNFSMKTDKMKYFRVKVTE